MPSLTVTASRTSGSTATSTLGTVPSLMLFMMSSHPESILPSTPGTKYFCKFLSDILSTYLHLGLGFLTFRLRGVPRKEINEVVEWGLKKLDLLQFADRPAGALSGGNKRKVSTAIALIGGPSLIFLVPM